jgi:Flp pilus assembly pilin Flp
MGGDFMKKQLVRVMRKFRGRSGQSLVEYALILALISVVAILVLKGIGQGASKQLSSVNAELD